MTNDISTLTPFIARAASTWLTHRDAQGNLEVPGTSDFILSRVQAFHDTVGPIDIEPIIRAVTFFAMHNSGAEMTHKATQALLSIVKLNENIRSYDTEVAIFDSALTEYLDAKRAETENPDYPM